MPSDLSAPQDPVAARLSAVESLLKKISRIATIYPENLSPAEQDLLRSL